MTKLYRVRVETRDQNWRDSEETLLVTYDRLEALRVYVEARELDFRPSFDCRTTLLEYISADDSVCDDDLLSQEWVRIKGQV